MAFHPIEGTLVKTRFIWVNGELVPWDDCRIHVLSHGLHYASAVFEGIRCYDTRRGPAIFRLHDHVRRLVDSARAYRMDIPFSVEALVAAILETAGASGHAACYLRPIAFRGYGSLGVNPLGAPVEVAIAAFPWGQYLGAGAVENGVDVRVSSFARVPANSLPAFAKCTANYANSQLVKLEALADGYAEGIALDVHGNVSEGSGQNVFLVRDGVIATPSLDCAILPGITRDSVLRLARDAGIAAEERIVPRSALLLADEAFFTGTAAEITPIRSIDRSTVGSGSVGPVTRRLQQAFFGIVSGEAADRHGWLTPLPRA